MNSTPTGEPPKMPSPEERRMARERTFLPARIAFGENGALSTQCTVTQLSSAGARLNVPASVTLPDRFDIEIPQRGFISRARLVWRKDDHAGVEFDREDDLVDDLRPDELHAKIRDLEATNVKLRAQVAELMQQVSRLTET
jgi:PilZ domain